MTGRQTTNERLTSAVTSHISVMIAQRLLKLELHQELWKATEGAEQGSLALELIGRRAKRGAILGTCLSVPRKYFTCTG